MHDASRLHTCHTYPATHGVRPGVLVCVRRVFRVLALKPGKVVTDLVLYGVDQLKPYSGCSYHQLFWGPLVLSSDI